jgi:arabinofuranosyltransferase
VSRKRRAAAAARRPAPAARHAPPVPWGAIVVLLIGAAFAWHAWSLQFTQDDAYISLRYARNLVEGNGLVFNPGERVEGYSNFTWTLLLALFLKLGAPAVETSRVLGILFGVLSVLAAGKLARALEGKWGAASIGAAALVAANPAFALWSTGGLETALYTFLVTAGLERGLAPGVGPRGRLAAPLLLCLAALSRPDGPLVFALWFALRLLDTWRGGPLRRDDGMRGLVRDGVLFVAPLVPYAIWKLAYYGDLLPNTYYAKAGVSPVYFSRGIEYALDWFRSYGLLGLAPLLALLSLARERTRGIEARLLLVWLGVGAYIVAIGGDVLYLHRFWLPILPIGAVLIARGTTWLAGTAFRAPRTAGAVAVASCLAIAFAGLRLNRDATNERRAGERGFVAKMLATGGWLRENMDPGSSIAVTTIGAIAYESRLVVIDMLGLTDREVARHPVMFDGLEDSWREVKYNAESVLRREPDGIVFSTDVRPSSAAERALYLYRAFHDSYYAMYFRSDPAQGTVRTIHVRRADPPPFDGTIVDHDGFGFIEEFIQGHVEKGRNHDDEAALAHFRKSVELGPREFHAAREWCAVTLWDLRRPEAASELEQVVADDPYSVAGMGRLALNRLEQGNMDEALELAERLTAIDPTDNTGWGVMGEVLRRRGQYEEAMKAIGRAVAIASTNTPQLLSLGNVAVHLDQLDLARRAMERALRISPDGAMGDAARQGLAAIAAVERGEISLEDLKARSR